MIAIETPLQLKRTRVGADTPTCAPRRRAQTEAVRMPSGSLAARVGPTLPFLDEFSREDAVGSVASHLDAEPQATTTTKKKRCCSANF